MVTVYLIPDFRGEAIPRADLVDAGVIFGTGFASFTGGPLHYIRQSGKEVLTYRLQTLEESDGSHFSRNVGWSTIS